MQSSLSEDPAGNEIPVVAMETVPTVHLTMDIDMDDGTMGMDMIGAVNCAAMVGAAANAHAISVLWYNYLGSIRVFQSSETETTENIKFLSQCNKPPASRITRMTGDRSPCSVC